MHLASGLAHVLIQLLEPLQAQILRFQESCHFQLDNFFVNFISERKSAKAKGEEEPPGTNKGRRGASRSKLAQIFQSSLGHSYWRPVDEVTHKLPSKDGPRIGAPQEDTNRAAVFLQLYGRVSPSSGRNETGQGLSSALR